MRVFLTAVAALLLCGSALSPSPHFGGRSPYGLGLYDGYRTPAPILRGIARAESDEHDDAIGDDGVSRGRMQLDRWWDAERAAKWGAFDPFSANDSIRIASCLFQENLAELGGEDKAIAAYRQGAQGVRENGAAGWYVERVRRAVK